MTARTITPSDTNADQTLVTANGEITGVIFHEPYAAQPGHRFEGMPYAVWTADRGHLAERFATVEDAADAITPQDKNEVPQNQQAWSYTDAEREANRAELRSRPHVVSVRGGKVHIDRIELGRHLPMCRENGIGMTYLTTDRDLTCLHCLGYIGQR